MNILKIWQHPHSRTEAASLGPRYLITSISYLNLLVSCIYLVINLRLGIDYRANLVQIFGSLSTLATLRFCQSHVPAAHIFLAVGVMTASSLIITFVSFPYTIMMWMPVFTILSVYLVGLLAGGVWSFLAISAASFAVLCGHQLNPNPEPIAAADLPVITVVTLYLTGFSAFIASMFFARSIKSLLLIQEKQNQELKEQNKTIHQYAQDKAMLVSIVVHDIASPLTIIIHAAEMAERQPEQRSHFLQKISKAASIIEEIARSVREFQSVESGKKKVTIAAVDLQQIFDRASFIFEERLQEKSLTLDFVRPAAPLRVLADEKSLSNSVINNLISNAIKFSHPGQRIVVSAIEEPDFISVQVRDFGVGMPESKIKTLFSNSLVSTSKGTRGEPGTGFGLPISKAYIDKFGGDIRVQSTEELSNPKDHGTTFTVRLRKAPSD